MLVLTRKTDERIQIGQEITVRILQIKGRTVRIGIEAPGGIQIVRGELLPSGAEPDQALNSQEGRAEAAHDTDAADGDDDSPESPAADAPGSRRAGPPLVRGARGPVNRRAAGAVRRDPTPDRLDPSCRRLAAVCRRAVASPRS